MKHAVLLAVMALASSCEMLDEPNVESILLKDAITVPTNLERVRYPESYLQRVDEVTVHDPYCAIAAETAFYPASYLGSHALPEIRGEPLPGDIQRAVGLKDAWVPDPSFNSCRSGRKDPMFDAYRATLRRVKMLGADQIHFTNYISFKDFDNATLDYGSTISGGVMRNITEAAHSQELDVVLYINVFLSGERPLEEQNVSNKNLSGERLERFLDNYGFFLLGQARLAEETGIKAIMLNNFDYEPGISGFEDLYQRRMGDLVSKIRKVYSGELILYIDGLRWAEQSKLTTLFQEVDAYLYTPPTAPLQDSVDKTVSVDNLQEFYRRDLARLGEELGTFRKQFYIRIIIQSEQDFLSEGWKEEAFCVRSGDDPCYQQGLTADFSSQAIAYEALMEALKEVHGNELQIRAVDTYGYWHTDGILPKNSQPHIGHTIRNKPAESIVRAWFAK